MIVCPRCQASMIESETGGYRCGACGHVTPVEKGIVFFHPEEKDSDVGMKGSLLDDVVETEGRHFWMSSRKDYISQIFDRYVKPQDSLLEIGAGTGFIAKHLIARGYRDYAIGDIHRRALELSGIYAYRHKYQFSLAKTVFFEHFDVVGLFDVLEHITDEDLALKNIYKMLKKGGKAIVTVPAHDWLWCKQDAIASHRRRYEVSTLKELFAKNGFSVLKASGFFFSLVPLMFLRRFLNRDDGQLCERDFRDRFKINPFLNGLLNSMLHAEMALFKNCSGRFGGSIILVAQKEK